MLHLVMHQVAWDLMLWFVGVVSWLAGWLGHMFKLDGLLLCSGLDALIRVPINLLNPGDPVLLQEYTYSQVVEALPLGLSILMSCCC